jgi:hypothetical protein
MNRTVLAIFLITVIAVSVAIFLIYHISGLQRQLYELQKPIDDARKLEITEFSSLSGWWNPVGVTMAVDFNITIFNTGVEDVDGAVLEINSLNFTGDPLNRTRALGIVHAGETIEIRESFFIGLQSYIDEFYNSSFVAALKLGNIVLDNRTLQITERQF